MSATTIPADVSPRLPATGVADLRDRSGARRRLAYFGPAFVAAVAYVDPGNFATNISGGAKFGFLLVWVIVMANLMAMLVQYLSAKIGIATGKNLAELCREHFPTPVRWGLWAQAEIVAIATDLAEFVGAAIALNLLFGVPPLASGLITAVIAFGVLGLQQRGYRTFEVAIAALLGIILLGFLYDLVHVPVDPGQIAGGLVPGFAGVDSVMLAVGIIGATVMPHVVYLHSALTQGRIGAKSVEERRELLRGGRIDVIVALSIAGVINLSMLVIAASLFHTRGMEVETIEAAHAGLGNLIGGGAALAFAVALLASGLSSSSVGTYAGQVVMQGFLNVAHPAAAAPAGDDAARPRRARDRRRHDAGARAQPGRAELRHPLRARADDPAHAPPRRDGRARQQAGDDRRGDRGRHADHRAERLPALPDLLRLAQFIDGISPCGLRTYLRAAP